MQSQISIAAAGINRASILKHLFSVLILAGLCLAHSLAYSQTTGFTYQGRLTDGGTAANGNYDLQFVLWDSTSGGTQVGLTQTLNGVSVNEGIFTVTLDFGANAFPGASRFLEISARPTSASSFTLLTPRQQITSTPYAVRSLNSAAADTAVNATQLGGVAASQYVQAGDTRLTDSRSPTAGSANYIQNTTNQQSSSNFSVSGDGTAGGTLSSNVVNATTQYNIGGNRILSASIPGFNTFVGFDAGAGITSGSGNSFFGMLAGRSNSTGSSNSFFGRYAGRANTAGQGNSFFGSATGPVNTTGSDNSFFGSTAGAANTTASANSFFGSGAGLSNTTGAQNSFFGASAGNANATGTNNAFFGHRAGSQNTTASANSFFGAAAGDNNTTGKSNSFFGHIAGSQNSTGDSNSFFGDRAGSSNSIGDNNSFFGADAGRANTDGYANSFFGYDAGIFNTSGFGNAFFGVSAGEGNKIGKNNAFFGASAGGANNGDSNVFFGSQAGATNITGAANTFVGRSTGLTNTTGSDNVFIGAAAGQSNVTGSTNTIIGDLADTLSPNLTNASAIGWGAQVGQNDSLVLGRNGTNVGIGISSPNARLHIAVNGGNILAGNPGCNSGFAGIGFGSSLSGCANYSLLGNGTDTIINRPTGGAIDFRENNVTQMTVAAGGKVSILNLGSAGSTQLCRNASNQISTCSSSLRYKKDLQPFTRGLALLNSLKPITFKWKSDNTLDLGFGAEDIAAVEPLLVTHNANGEVEGVKYDRITAVLVNAVKEQQSQIQQQQSQIVQQQAEIKGLKQIVCAKHSRAAVCGGRHR